MTPTPPAPNENGDGSPMTNRKLEEQRKKRQENSSRPKMGEYPIEIIVSDDSVDQSSSAAAIPPTNTNTRVTGERSFNGNGGGGGELPAPISTAAARARRLSLKAAAGQPNSNSFTSTRDKEKNQSEEEVDANSKRYSVGEPTTSRPPGIIKSTSFAKQSGGGAGSGANMMPRPILKRQDSNSSQHSSHSNPTQPQPLKVITTPKISSGGNEAHAVNPPSAVPEEVADADNESDSDSSEEKSVAVKPPSRRTSMAPKIITAPRKSSKSSSVEGESSGRMGPRLSINTRTAIVEKRREETSPVLITITGENTGGSYGRQSVASGRGSVQEAAAAAVANHLAKVAAASSASSSAGRQLSPENSRKGGLTIQPQAGGGLTPDMAKNNGGGGGGGGGGIPRSNSFVQPRRSFMQQRVPSVESVESYMKDESSSSSDSSEDQEIAKPPLRGLLGAEDSRGASSVRRASYVPPYIPTNSIYTSNHNNNNIDAEVSTRSRPSQSGNNPYSGGGGLTVEGELSRGRPSILGSRMVSPQPSLSPQSSQAPKNSPANDNENENDEYEDSDEDIRMVKGPKSGKSSVKNPFFPPTTPKDNIASFSFTAEATEGYLANAPSRRPTSKGGKNSIATTPQGVSIKSSAVDISENIAVKEQLQQDDVLDDEERNEYNQGGKENALEKYFVKVINDLIEKYYEKVTYKQESWMYLLLLLPFIAVAVSLPYVSTNQFPDASTALVVKITIVILGIFAVHTCEFVNQRHADLSTIAGIINGEATVRKICLHVEGKAQSRLLMWLSVIFYAILMITEFSITSTYVNTSYGQGYAWTLNTNNLSALSDVNSTIFQLSVGSQFGCVGCVGFLSEDALIVPVSEILQTVDNGGLEIDVISESQQALISITAQCFAANPTLSASDSEIQLAVENFEVGTDGATTLDLMIVSSLNFHSTLVGMRCIVVTRDLLGSSNVRYGISTTGVISRKSVDSVAPSDPSSCSSIGAVCLNSPSTIGLSAALLNESFSNLLVSTSQDYAYAMKLFPDPSSLSAQDAVFSLKMAEAIGMILLTSASKFSYHMSHIDVLSNSVGVQLNINSALMILTIIAAVLCPIIATVLIMVDIIKVGKTHDYLLRRLSQSIRPGKRHIEELSEYARSIFEPGEEDWDLAPVRFGEDRATTGDALGRLRFGGKRDVVKFKATRAYF